MLNETTGTRNAITGLKSNLKGGSELWKALQKNLRGSSQQ
jgi:hypothetical protein